MTTIQCDKCFIKEVHYPITQPYNFYCPMLHKYYW